MPSILWFRQDLRLRDNPALAAACAAGTIIPVYILDPAAQMGGASRWWLHHSLAALQRQLPGLILRRGHSPSVLMAIAAQTSATVVHANHHYEPWFKEAESELGADIELVLHRGNQLADPSAIRTGSGGRYRIFTPWWRNLLDHMPPRKPLPMPEKMDCAGSIESDSLDDLHLLPTRPDWASGFNIWTPGEEGARQKLRDFLPTVNHYDGARNFPAQEGISRLSAHLHFGEISPATVWQVTSKTAGRGAEPYLRQIGWRDYATNLIDQFPDYGWVNGRRAYDRMPWRSGPEADADFENWTKGRTGYPIVDAGMRELWETGFMHNRVRMIAASFLIKHLLIDWRRGERWFWDTLVDADYAANASNWQWVAGTGLDSPMFSRMMAPLSQSEKFDAGNYVRRWVPELATISDPYVHDPDEFGARPAAYPAKLIGHREARERALEAGRSIRDI